MTQVDCKSKVRLVIKSFLHPYPEKWEAIGHAVVYYARSAHTFSARIKCRHCNSKVGKSDDYLYHWVVPMSLNMTKDVTLQNSQIIICRRILRTTSTHLQCFIYLRF